jgi:transcriptional regulator with XRE-family HTH domain
MDNFNEKLKKWFAEQGIKQTDIAQRLNISPTIVNNYLNGQRRFGKNVALKWSNEFGLNPMWLMSGGTQGEITGALVNIVTTNDDVINIPILSPDARGGFLPNDKTDIDQYTIGMMPFNRQIAHAGDVVIPVYGDSMTPKYPAGSYILIRPIEAWREYIELGRSYVLELADWRRIIKIVRKGSDSTHYTLDSYNVDYESNEVAISFINNMWLVVASVTREEL